MKYSHTILLLLFVLLFSLVVKIKHTKESMNEYIISAHIIHLERSTNRIENIENNKQRIGFPTTVFNAVDAKNINRAELIEKGELSEEFSRKAKDGEIGCYLSHKNVIKEIADASIDNGYSIIFEDDLDITTDKFDDTIKNVINETETKNIEFDVIYIGDCFIENRTDDAKITEHLYIFKESNITTVSYMINNNSARKIYDLLNCAIESPIDNYLTQLCYEKKIISYVLNPKIVKQNRTNYNSEIQI